MSRQPDPFRPAPFGEETAARTARWTRRFPFICILHPEPRAHGVDCRRLVDDGRHRDDRGAYVATVANKSPGLEDVNIVALYREPAAGVVAGPTAGAVDSEAPRSTPS
jgi:hypothetical protein